MTTPNAIAKIPAKEQLEAEANPILTTAQSFTIDSPEMYEIAGEELRAIKAKYKTLEDRRKAITGPMDKAKKEVMDLFRKPLETLEKAEAALKGTMLTYSREQQRIADEKRREAEKAAEEERQRLAAEAAEAEKEGDIAGAIAIQTAATMVTASVPEVQQQTKLAGITTTTRWRAELVDKAEFVRHALETPEFWECVQIDMKPLNQMATALKDKLNIPGVKAIPVEGISARS